MSTKKTISKGLGSCYGPRVLVKQDNAEERSAGGIIIPDTVKEKPDSGIIVALGEHEDGTPLKKLKIGQRVLFGKYAGATFNLKGVDYLLLQAKDIQFIPDEY